MWTYVSIGKLMMFLTDGVAKQYPSIVSDKVVSDARNTRKKTNKLNHVKMITICQAISRPRKTKKTKTKQK